MMPCAVDETGVEQRRQGERRGRHVAAGRGDEPGALQVGAVALGQAVDGLGEQVGLVVLEAVPLRVQRRRRCSRNAADRSTTQPTRPTSCGTRAIDASCGRPRKTTSTPSDGGDGRTAAVERWVGRGERRRQVGRPAPGLRVGGGHDDVELGMGGEQAQQLDAREAGCADDRR